MLVIFIAAAVLVVAILMLFGGASRKPTPQPYVYDLPHGRPLSLSEMRFVRWHAYEYADRRMPDEIHAGAALVAGYVELTGRATFDCIPVVASIAVPEGEVWWRSRGTVVAVHRGLDPVAPRVDACEGGDDGRDTARPDRGDARRDPASS